MARERQHPRPHARVSGLLGEARELASELRRRLLPPSAEGATDSLALRRLNSSLGLMVRCADLVLALDAAAQALDEEERSELQERSASPAVLDIGRLAAQGLFAPGADSGRFVLARGGAAYDYDLRQADENAFELTLADAAAHRHVIEIDATRPGFGGVRYWFRCPGAGGKACGRRVLHLYVPGTNAEPACRSCHRVPYGGRAEGRGSRAVSFDRLVPGHPAAALEPATPD